MYLKLPNLLTYSRILVIPLLVAAFYLDDPLGNRVACALFALAAVTDYLDGYLARAWSQQSNLGRFLDPVADKLMVAAAILMMVAVGMISGWSILAALVILCREILVSGLREFLAELRVGLPVSKLAKWKTAIQMVALTLLLLGDAGPAWLPIVQIGDVALWIAAVLTLITGYDYLRAGLRHMREDGSPGPAE
ncbi:MAG TPA: CDP-diacylglycerol--glycerol-3-phosphate 3-phosphatidyltransferase [Alphaproteobacteria bacterium]|nr:CDP-diacylglycerol--glycerol-3-phosphate 3-phosphatidyltransferase [Alphaproteobacteria bacterium]